MADPRLGPALGSSDAELQDSARITTDDLARVRGWLQVYGRQLAPYADAEPQERDFLPLPIVAGLLASGVRFAWIAPRGVYYDLRRRRAVDPEDVRRELDRAIDRAAREARAYTLGLRESRLSLVDWELGMRERSKLPALAADVLGRGGTKRTHLAALEAMQARVAEQYLFLRRFAQQIERGEQPLDGRALSRAALYVRAARTDHFRAREDVARSVGFDQIRTVLSIADHCRSDGERPGCPEEAARGWVPLGSMSLPGDRVCRQNCRCSLRYRNSSTGEEWGPGEDEIRLEVA